MICVDTSVWVAALRGPVSPSSWHLSELIEADDVFLPALVRLELLTGAPARDLALLAMRLDALEPAIPDVATWQRAEQWAGRAAASGQRFGIVDLLIGAAAAERGAAIWSLDADFARLNALGLVELYVPPPATGYRPPPA